MKSRENTYHSGDYALPTRLSKSQVLAARQCPKRLWLEVNQPDLRTSSPESRRRLEQGHRLHETVHRLLPEGRLVDPEVTLDAAVRATRQHLATFPDQPLFEATFTARDTLVRADIIQTVDNGWRLTEVKSSTRVKAYHLDDCAVQTWVIREAGYPVTQAFVGHVNKHFVYQGDGDYRDLLRYSDVTETVEDLLPAVPGWVDSGLEALSGGKPGIDVGPQCTTPFKCPFLAHCSPPSPEYPVSSLPNRGGIVDALIDQGIHDIRDIPDGRLTRPLHRRIRDATISGTPYIAEELTSRLQQLPYPRYYLDFESIQFVVPIWAGTRPYEQLPFQWSCQVETLDGQLTETAFLDVSGTPPMRACAEQLVATLGDNGPVLTYSPFERQVINALARRFPDLAPRLAACRERIVDLLPMVKAHYYHPAMRGSFSIKAVLPTVAPHLSYDALGDVKDGTAAQTAFDRAIDQRASDEERGQLRAALLRYCALDTLAMVELVRTLSSRNPS
jgi:hypothetical protein